MTELLIILFIIAIPFASAYVAKWATLGIATIIDKLMK